MTHTVVGIFDDRGEAQSAMNELVDAGFIQEHIDLSNRSSGGTVDNSYTGTEHDTTADNSYTSTEANQGIGDRITNFFSSLFDDESTVRNYTNAASDADAILTVQVDSDERANLAQEIMDRNGAIDVDERGMSQTGQNFTGGTDMNARTSNSDVQSSTTIPVVEENIHLGKREVERGGARIRSRIVERPVEESIRLREEHVVVNRRPVDREVREGDLQNFQPGEMEITEHAEVPIVGKQARVVEEVEVGKTVSEREETVRDTVRSTDVDVEKIEGQTNRTKKRGA